MKAKEYDKIISEAQQRRKRITKNKRHDYAAEYDVLGNFKRMGDLTVLLRLDELYRKYPAVAEALKIHALKLDRIVNLLLKGKKPRNESLLDTFDDGANYWDLAYAAYLETLN